MLDVVDEAETTVMLMANSPGLSPVPCEEVAAETTCIVHCAFLAVNTDPTALTVVGDEFAPVPPAMGDEAVWTFEIA